MDIKFKTSSDKTKIYSFKNFCKILDQVETDNDKRFLIRDMFLVLLYAKKDNPIYGRTMLIKQLFLLYNEVFDKFQEIAYQEPNFIPYDFGPYSFKSMKILDDLRFSKEIVVNGKRNTKKESFSLSEKGSMLAKGKFEALPKNLQTVIGERRIGWDQLGTRGILKYVYEKYPNMKEKSKIKRRYKDITWGIGKA
jgi:hypothetical protein